MELIFKINIVNSLKYLKNDIFKHLHIFNLYKINFLSIVNRLKRIGKNLSSNAMNT